ncbi:hypothetical protein [Novosphingobium sp. AP12]|uniref:hypothetical protein n=1 Tax=Novosphingobium sp. AP12 TaxID=1144305 RepID=UPI00027205E2|nr:hypothetical protein [Novosphingobium sp. AP12]EJL23966.1 hypothetical protein PMI02_03886 [Novosphingobium sp. AP12]
MPDAPVLPEDDQGWRALNPQLGARAQSFHLLVHGAKQAISGASEYGDAEDVAIELEKYAAVVGLEAYRLATDLADEYGLPRQEMPWNYVEHFEAEQARIEAHWEQSRAAHLEMMEGLEVAADDAAAGG